MNAADIARQLFACAAEAGNSEHKRAHFIRLPEIVLAQAAAIAEGRYRPQPFTVFAVTDPKLREIFAPAFAEQTTGDEQGGGRPGIIAEDGSGPAERGVPLAGEGELERAVRRRLFGVTGAWQDGGACAHRVPA